jgi:hypothetical protein
MGDWREIVVFDGDRCQVIKKNISKDTNRRLSRKDDEYCVVRYLFAEMRMYGSDHDRSLTWRGNYGVLWRLTSGY